MKIAVAAVDEKVSMHFGKCKNFMVYEVENNNIINSEKIMSPGHVHGLLPEFLGNMEVNLVISGGMGQGAMNLLKQKKIEVITGANGLAKDAVESYLRGELESSGAGCMGHGHHNHKHEHHHGHGGHCGCGDH